MNAEQEAWTKWKESKAGKKAIDARSLGTSSRADEYLQNRFREVFLYAFFCGELEGKELAKERLAKVIDNS